MKLRRAHLILPAALLVVRVLPDVSGAPRATSAAPGPREPWLRPVPKAQCGPKDRQESGLQGQTTAAERFGGAAEKGFNCNLELVGQFSGEGASWQLAWFDRCAYYGTANGKDQQRKGVVVIDAADPRHPKPTAYLDAPAMLDPWESLKVNETRKLLAGVQARGAEFAGGVRGVRRVGLPASSAEEQREVPGRTGTCR